MMSFIKVKKPYPLGPLEVAREYGFKYVSPAIRRTRL